MSVCRLNEGLSQTEQKAADSINNAFKTNNMEGASNIMKEVNESRLTDRANCNNVDSLHKKLDPAAQEAIKVNVTDPDNYHSKGFLSFEEDIYNAK